MVDANMPLGRLAFDVASAMSEAVDSLCVLLAWNDAGAIGDPPIDGAKLKDAMGALGEAFREVLHGGRLPPLDPPIVEEDLARVVRLEEAIPAWPSTGALPPELIALGEACVAATWRASWREILAEARQASVV